MALFGSSSSSKQETKVSNVSIADTSAPAFGALEGSPVIADNSLPFTLVQSGKGKKYITINAPSVDPGALDSFQEASKTTIAALNAIAANSAQTITALQESAREQNKDLKDFAETAGQPDKGVFSENIKILVLAALMGAALLTT